MDCFKKKHNYCENILIENIKSSDTYLQKYLEYGILGGKCLRPIIVLEMCSEMGCSKTIINNLIVMIEYIHCASLILDDLPCMDNDSMRRDKPTFHVKYNIRVAYLITNYMLNKALQNLTNLLVTTTKKIEISTLVFINNNYTSLGQLVDLSGNKSVSKQLICISEQLLKNNLILQYSNRFHNLEELKRVVMLNLKTFPLFYLSFQIPVILGVKKKTTKKNRNSLSVEYVQYIAFIFSLAFQIADDFEDEEHDSNSFIVLLGKDKTKEIYLFCREDFFDKIKSVELELPSLEYVFNILDKKVL